MNLNIFALPDPAKLAAKQLREAKLQLMEVEASLEQQTAAKAALVERIKRLEGYVPNDWMAALRSDITGVSTALGTDASIPATRQRRTRRNGNTPPLANPAV